MIRTTSFSLHPQKKMKSLFLKDIEPSSLSDILSRMSQSQGNGSSSYALLSTDRIISFSQIEAAANMALLRNPTSYNSARDTVICVAGTTNPDAAVRDFLVNKEKILQESNDKMNVILIGFDCEDREMLQIIEAHSKFIKDLSEIKLLNVREEDFQSKMIKTYKLTCEEVASFGLEECVVHRIATKFLL